MTIPLVLSEFSPSDMQAFEPAMKIGLLATVTPEGMPHLTLISSLKAGSPNTVAWGQFMEGSSKHNLQHNPRTGFLIMTLDKHLWRGKAHWTHSEKSGTEYDWFNNIPMFRYNAYFGIHTVHFMDLIGHTGQQALPMNSIILAALQTMSACALFPQPGRLVMNAWTQSFFNKIDNLKFLTWVDADGYPWIVPVIQARGNGPEHLLLSTGVYHQELAGLPAGTPVAVLGMALTMEDVLVRGIYQGIESLNCASIYVNWVYNPMPPVPGPIYPKPDLHTITHFS